MTQVKDKTDQQLNLVLALLCGHTEISEHEDMRRWQRNDYEGNGVVVLYGKHYIVRANGKYGTWAPCSDPAASLEVQAKAIEVDAGGYIQNLLIVIFGELVYEREFSNRLLDFMTAAKINNATPRERAEAAYITLQGAKG